MSPGGAARGGSGAGSVTSGPTETAPLRPTSGISRPEVPYSPGMDLKEWSAGRLLVAWTRAAILTFFVFVFGAIYQGTALRPFFPVLLAVLFGIPATMLFVTALWLRGRKSSDDETG